LTPKIRCYCRFRDAYDCWRSQYPSPWSRCQTDEDIHFDGGPCQCRCHSREGTTERYVYRVRDDLREAISVFDRMEVFGEKS
jgi:hypothetical protein